MKVRSLSMGHRAGSCELEASGGTRSRSKARGRVDTCPHRCLLVTYTARSTVQAEVPWGVLEWGTAAQSADPLPYRSSIEPPGATE